MARAIARGWVPSAMGASAGLGLGLTRAMDWNLSSHHP